MEAGSRETYISGADSQRNRWRARDHATDRPHVGRSDHRCRWWFDRRHHRMGVRERLDVYVQKKKGIRYAYLEILPMVKGDVILSLSPDGNCPAAAIPAILDKIREGYDMVGCRVGT